MQKIILHTSINAPIALCFDLSRSIDLHKASTSHTKEEAIAGVTTGLIGLNEFVTWRAIHFGISQTLTSEITQFRPPYYFVDQMVEGAFKYFRHEHSFEEMENGTLMIDRLEFKSPFGPLGRLADSFVLKHYMTRLLQKRNETIKGFAESDKWKAVLQ